MIQNFNIIYELIDFVKKHNPLYGMQQHANLDLVYLSRIAHAHGNIFTDKIDCSRCGCEWLIPLGLKINELAILVFNKLNTVTEEDKKKFIENPEYRESMKKAFAKVWDIPISQIVMLEEMKEGNILDFHLMVKSFVLKLDGTWNEPTAREEFLKLLEETWFQKYKEVKAYLRATSPYKRHRMDMEDTHDVGMWDGKVYTDLRDESIDKLLAEHGYSFRMKDYYNQGGGKIFKEIDEKRIIRYLKIKDTRQVGVSKTAYFTRIQRVAKIALLIGASLVKVNVVRNDKTYLDDKHWFTEDYPTICKIHLIPTICKLVPEMTSKAKELFPNHEVNSERSAEKLFDDIAKKYSLPKFDEEFGMEDIN